MASSRNTRLRSDRYNANITKRGVVAPPVDVSQRYFVCLFLVHKEHHLPSLLDKLFLLLENRNIGPYRLPLASWFHFLCVGRQVMFFFFFFLFLLSPFIHSLSTYTSSHCALVRYSKFSAMLQQAPSFKSVYPKEVSAPIFLF